MDGVDVHLQKGGRIFGAFQNKQTFKNKRGLNTDFAFYQSFF